MLRSQYNYINGHQLLIVNKQILLASIIANVAENSMENMHVDQMSGCKRLIASCMLHHEKLSKNFQCTSVSCCFWMQNDLLLGHNLCLLHSLQSLLTILAPIVKPTMSTCKSEEMSTFQSNSGHNILQNSLEYYTVPTFGSRNGAFKKFALKVGK